MMKRSSSGVSSADVWSRPSSSSRVRDLLEWTREELPKVLGLQNEMLDEIIVENIIAYDDKDDLFQFISFFVESLGSSWKKGGRNSSSKERIEEFVTLFFEYKYSTEKNNFFLQREKREEDNFPSYPFSQVIKNSSHAFPPPPSSLSTTIATFPSSSAVAAASSSLLPSSSSSSPTLSLAGKLLPASKTSSMCVGTTVVSRSSVVEGEKGAAAAATAAARRSGGLRNLSSASSVVGEEELLGFAMKPPPPPPPHNVRRRSMLEASRRRICLCLASEHKLLNNCLKCGKIVCTEEGEGPCLFCGNLVRSKDDGLSILNERGGGEGEGRGIRGEEDRSGEGESFRRALANQQRLVEYDENAEQRTVVFDDQTDWFSEAHNIWLNDNDRKIAMRKAKEVARGLEEESRKSFFTLDFMGRQVIEEKFLKKNEEDEKDFDEFLKSTQKRREGGGRILSGNDESIDMEKRREWTDEAKEKRIIIPNQHLEGRALQLYWDVNDVFDEAEKKRNEEDGVEFVKSLKGKWGDNQSESLSKKLRMRKAEEEMDEIKEEECRSRVCFLSTPVERRVNGERGERVEIELVESDDDEKLNICKVSDHPNPPIEKEEEEEEEEEERWQLGEALPSLYTDDDESTIDGMCLSLHQPWASLIVGGFKRLEGRGWTTKHRGRLWIHAAKKIPRSEEISAVEKYYSTLYGPPPARPYFGAAYPTGVLLGRVDMVDCLSHEELEFEKKKILSDLNRNSSNKLSWRDDAIRLSLNEENDSPFVFLLTRPHRLISPIAMKGEYKLWRLKAEYIPSYTNALRSVRWPQKIGEKRGEERI